MKVTRKLVDRKLESGDKPKELMRRQHLGEKTDGLHAGWVPYA